ncbi:hypothetical protein NLG97_g3071 [Lecanicillium saksenae]|uniref:Uncharacterized protein n=1 Tax=Lecanicillium saksenae TaxID=468837 RepID=A0ACC1R2H3_9HYPO|nr:hypothetical protein NLG97_g3071 [Lecanicillium saksenae]
MNWTTATRPTLAPLTTPFVVPASCTDSFNTTITFHDGNAASYTAYAAWPQTSSGCQATAANVHRDGATIVARPGVCPSGWAAYNLRVDDPQYYPNADDTASVTFAAVCCSSGFSADSKSFESIPSFGPACTKLVSKTSNVVSGSTVTTFTVSAHVAWQIEWMTKDVPTLTPQPPSLGMCYDVQIPTWTPGSEVHGRKHCRSLQQSPDAHQYDAVLYLVIILPTVIGFLLLVGSRDEMLLHTPRMYQGTDIGCSRFHERAQFVHAGRKFPRFCSSQHASFILATETKQWQSRKMAPVPTTPMTQHLIARRDKLYEQLCANSGPASNRQMLEVYREYQQIEEILGRTDQNPNKKPPQSDKRKQRHDDDENAEPTSYIPPWVEQARKAREAVAASSKPATKKKD